MQPLHICNPDPALECESSVEGRQGTQESCAGKLFFQMTVNECGSPLKPKHEKRLRLHATDYRSRGIRFHPSHRWLTFLRTAELHTHPQAPRRLPPRLSPRRGTVLPATQWHTIPGLQPLRQRIPWQHTPQHQTMAIRVISAAQAPHTRLQMKTLWRMHVSCKLYPAAMALLKDLQ
jgi:hypothetical protein